jgi:hypothetical protein
VDEAALAYCDRKQNSNNIYTKIQASPKRRLGFPVIKDNIQVKAEPTPKRKIITPSPMRAP